MLSKLLFNPIAFIIITGLCLVFSFSLYSSAQKTKDSSSELNVLEREIVGMEKEVEKLELASQQAEQPFTKEKIIRNELLMQKPGEYIVQIPDEIEGQSKTIEQSAETTPWQAWKKLIF